MSQHLQTKSGWHSTSWHRAAAVLEPEGSSCGSAAALHCSGVLCFAPLRLCTAAVQGCRTPPDPPGLSPHQITLQTPGKQQSESGNYYHTNKARDWEKQHRFTKGSSYLSKWTVSCKITSSAKVGEQCLSFTCIATHCSPQPSWRHTEMQAEQGWERPCRRPICSCPL